MLRMLRDLTNCIRSGFAPANWMIVDHREIVGPCPVTKPPAAHVLEISCGTDPSRGPVTVTPVAAIGASAMGHRDYRISAITGKTLRSQRAVPASSVTQRL